MNRLSHEAGGPVAETEDVMGSAPDRAPGRLWCVIRRPAIGGDQPSWRLAPPPPATPLPVCIDHQTPRSGPGLSGKPGTGLDLEINAFEQGCSLGTSKLGPWAPIGSSTRNKSRSLTRKSPATRGQLAGKASKRAKRSDRGIDARRASALATETSRSRQFTA